MIEKKSITKTHGGLVGAFGESLILTGEIPKETGKNLNKSLELKNKARYDYHAIDRDHVDFVCHMAKQIITWLQEKISSESKKET